MATIPSIEVGSNPDKLLYDMALEAGVPIPRHIKKMDIHMSVGEVPTITFECLMDVKFTEIYFAWLTAKRMKKG